MAVSHVFSNAVADWTGTVTVFDSAGATGTVAATNLARPQDWNSAHNQFYTLTGNTTGNTTASGTNVIFAGSGGISVGGSTGTVVISGPAPVTHHGVDLFSIMPAINFQQGQGTLHIQPATLPNVDFDRIGLRIFLSNDTNSSGSFTLTNIVGIYTKNASTLSLLSSTSNTLAVTNSGTVGIYSSIGNHRIISLGWTGTLTEGDYWIAIGSSSTSGGANCSISQLAASFNAGASFATFGGFFSVNSNASNQPALGRGVYSAATGTAPNSIAFSDIRGTNYASGAQRIPAWLLISGTA